MKAICCRFSQSRWRTARRSSSRSSSAKAPKASARATSRLSSRPSSASSRREGRYNRRWRIKRMTITLNLTPEQERTVLKEAAEKGMPPDAFVLSLVDELALYDGYEMITPGDVREREEAIA